jgi:hypothetical protein
MLFTEKGKHNKIDIKKLKSYNYKLELQKRAVLGFPDIGGIKKQDFNITKPTDEMM